MSSSVFGKSHSHSDSSYNPPQWAQPLFQKMMSDLMRNYESGKGGNVYKGQRIADLSDASKSSIEGLLGNANRYNEADLNNLISQKNFSENNLKDMAAGKLIGNNTEFNHALNNSLDDAATAINRQMSGAGRYGSGANNAVLANQLGHIAQSANAQQYNQDVNNMLRANSQIDSSRMNQASNWLNYLRGRGDAYEKSLEGGRFLDKNQQDKLNANRDMWEEQDNQGWNRLKMLEQLLSGSVGRYNNRSTDSDRTNSNLGGFLGKLIGK